MPLKRSHLCATVVMTCWSVWWPQSALADDTDPSKSPASSSSVQEESGERTSSDDAAGTSSEQLTLDQAREAFLEGRNLIGEGKWAAAERQFRLAARAKNTPGLRYYIGYCQEKQGLLVEAMTTYRQAEELLTVQKAPDVAELVPEAIERVNGELSLLLLYDVPAGAVLTVDGKKRPLSQQFYVNPGTHRLLLRKDGYDDFSHTFSLAAGEQGRLHVEMRPLLAAPTESESHDSGDEDGSPLRTAVFWSSAGVGVAGLGVGITGAVLLSSTKREVNDLNEVADEISGGDDAACSDPSAEMETVCADLAAGGKQSNAMGNLMVGGFVAVGVGAAGALLTHFLWPKASVRVDVGLAPAATTLGFRGRF